MSILDVLFSIEDPVHYNCSVSILFLYLNILFDLLENKQNKQIR